MLLSIYYPGKGYLSGISLNCKQSYLQAYSFEWSMDLRKALIFQPEHIRFMYDFLDLQSDLDITLFEVIAYEEVSYD